MCAGFLLAALVTMCAAALYPAAKIVRRQRREYHAQLVADGVLDSVRAELEEAREYVKIDGSGGNVEFVQNDGSVLRISAGGPDHAGRLLYQNLAASGGGELVFPETFYSGLYLDLRFSPVMEDGLLTRVQITARLGSGMEDTGAGMAVSGVVYTERVIADLRHATILQDGVRVQTGLGLDSGEREEAGYGADCPGAAA